MNTTQLTGAVRLIGAAAALYVAATGKAPGIVRAGLGVAALALGVTGFSNLTWMGDDA